MADVVFRDHDDVPAESPDVLVERALDLSHLGTGLLARNKQDGVRDIAGRLIRQMPTYRSREQVARFFGGTDLAPPGLVPVEEWRPEPGAGETGRSSLWCGAGRKR